MLESVGDRPRSVSSPGARVFGIGPTELIVILLVALVVFGPRRLPEIGRTLGRSLREFQRTSAELRQELDLGLDEDFEPPASAPSPAPPQKAEVAEPDAESRDAGAAGTSAARGDGEDGTRVGPAR